VLSAGINTQTNVDCRGNSTGAITITVSGGTSGYSYLWSNNATTKDISGLTAGTYSLTVTDAHSCLFNVTATITQPSAVLSAGINTQTNVDCRGNSTGAITITVGGGTTRVFIPLEQ